MQPSGLGILHLIDVNKSAVIPISTTSTAGDGSEDLAGLDLRRLVLEQCQCAQACQDQRDPDPPPPRSPAGHALLFLRLGGPGPGRRGGGARTPRPSPPPRSPWPNPAATETPPARSTTTTTAIQRLDTAQWRPDLQPDWQRQGRDDRHPQRWYDRARVSLRSTASTRSVLPSSAAARRAGLFRQRSPMQ